MGVQRCHRCMGRKYKEITKMCEWPKRVSATTGGSDAQNALGGGRIVSSASLDVMDVTKHDQNRRLYAGSVSAFEMCL